MAKKKVLYVTDRIPPYLPADEASVLNGQLPQKMGPQGFEVRTFMPKFGSVNERRNQLHEVIRLSGMNIPIGDNDHPLIIKVASLQPARMQVYFIDNDDYFLKNDDDADALGSNRPDNDERMLFFSRGTSETVRKLRWDAEIVHTAGWVTGLMPLYLRNIFPEDPSYSRAKIIYSVLPGEISGGVDAEFFAKLISDGIPAEALEPFRDMSLDTRLIHRMAMQYADAVIFHTPEVDPELLEFAQQKGLKIGYAAEMDDSGKDMAAYYNELLEA